MKTINICGVPEHFNLPWHFAIEEGAFEDRGILVKWTDVPEGTGRMAKMLEEGETDMAIILTEGIVKSIAEGNPSAIVQTYVASPLLWGIHVDANSKFQKESDLEGKIGAISRYGSGSHLMSYVNAHNRKWDLEDLKFELVNTLPGAVQALGEGKAHYFMWEHFTTKPWVENGTFRRLGDCPTPWPCFVIAGNVDFLNENTGLVEHVLDVINSYTKEFKRIPSIDRTLANRYGQQLEDIKEWLSLTTWSQEQLDEIILNEVIHHLTTLNLLKNNTKDVCFLRKI